MLSHGEATEKVSWVSGMAPLEATLYAYCCIVLLPLVAYINQPKALFAAVAYRMIINTDSPINKVARRQEGSTGKCAEWWRTHNNWRGIWRWSIHGGYYCGLSTADDISIDECHNRPTHLLRRHTPLLKELNILGIIQNVSCMKLRARP
jgi:hypothetical protein